MLSGNKDTDILILGKLSDKDLTNICRVNSYIHSLCSDDNFWRNRVIYRFKLPIDTATKIKDYLSWNSLYSWKEYYFWLSSILVYKYSKKLKPNDFLFEFPNLYVISSYINNLVNNIPFISLLEEKIQALKLSSLPSWLGEEFLTQIRRKIFRKVFVNKIDMDVMEEEINSELYLILEQVKTIFAHTYL